MRILVTCFGFPPAYRGGGPIRTMAGMLASADVSHQVALLTSNADLGCDAPLVVDNHQWKAYGDARVLYLDRGLRAQVSGLRRGLALKPDVIYLNSLFNPQFSLPLTVLQKLHRTAQVVIAPRGELQDGAMASKKSKKRTFLHLARNADLYDGVIWHASSKHEALKIHQAFGDDVRIIIREDDTLLPQRAELPAALQQRENVLKAAFVGRITPHKGLHIALQALSEIRQRVDLSIFGPEEDPAYLRECRKLARAVPNGVNVRFAGVLENSQVRQALSENDVLLLPTAGENFGHIIAESMSVGCPVICTDTTPWSERLRGGGGVIVDSREPCDWRKVIDWYAQGGPAAWHGRRVEAANAYERWQVENRQPHFFDMLASVMGVGPGRSV